MSAQIFLDKCLQFKVRCTGKVCFPKESKTCTPKITGIFLYVCCINKLESIMCNVRSRAVSIRLSCIGACTALVETLPAFAEARVFQPMALLSVEELGLCFSQCLQSMEIVCISYKVTNVSNSKKALKSLFSSSLWSLWFLFLFSSFLSQASFSMLVPKQNKKREKSGSKLAFNYFRTFLLNAFYMFWCVFLLLKTFTNPSGMKRIQKMSVESYSEE